MRLDLIENLHPRFRKLLQKESAAREVISEIEGATHDEWIELRGQLKILCRLKKPAVEAAIPRIREPILAITDKKLRDACLQLAGQYVAVIVREELGGQNTGSKNRVSELMTRAEVFDRPEEPSKPRKPRGVIRKAHRLEDLGDEFMSQLAEAKPNSSANSHNHELDEGAGSSK